MKPAVVTSLLLLAAPVSAATVELELLPNARDKSAATYRIALEVADSRCSSVHLKSKDPKDPKGTLWYRVEVCPDKVGLGVEVQLPDAELRASAHAIPGRRLVLWRIERLDGTILEVAMTRH